MKKVKLFLIVILCSAFSSSLISCDKDDSDMEEMGQSTTKDLCPESMVGKIIRWDGGNESNERLEFFSATDCQSNWSSDFGTYQYNKISPTKANLSFVIMQRVNYVQRCFRYNVKLEFINKNEFTIKGTKSVTGGLSGDGTYAVDATGSYVSDLWGKQYEY